MSDSVSEEVMKQFNEAVEKINASKSASPSNAQKLQMYGYYKFVTVGPCNTSRPGWLDPVGQSKWDAWNGVDAKLPKAEAIRLYIELVNSLTN